MAKWSVRSTLYKWTLILLYFVFLCYMAAFSVPTWYGNDSDATVSYFKGLWLQCTPVSDDADFDNCTVVAFGDDNLDWMDGVRGVWVGGACFFLLAILISMADNCCCGTEDSKDYGVSAIWALIAGLDGAAGVIVVAVKTADEDQLNHYRWGYFIACASSGLTIILSIMLFLTRNANKSTDKARASRTADYVYNSGKNGGPYLNHGFHRDDMPMQNGYHSQPPYSMYRGDHPQPTAPYGNSLSRSRPHSSLYNGNGYAQQGYDLHRPNQRASMAESADLSNGYTTELINAEHSLSRSNGGHRPQDNYNYGRY